MPQPKITQQQFRTTFNLTTHHLCFPIEYGIITDLESVERGKRPQDLILGDSRGYDDVEGSATCEEPSEQDEPHRNWPLVELQLLARPPDPAPLDGHLPLRFWVELTAAAPGAEVGVRSGPSACSAGSKVDAAEGAGTSADAAA